MFVSIGMFAALAGCAATPLAPTVQVTPGRGKSSAQFAVDDNYCRQYGSDQVKGLVTSANSQAVAAMLSGVNDEDTGAPITGASQQSGIQAQYDRAYGRCMFANQNIVPGYSRAPVRTARPVHRTAPATASSGDNATASAPAAATWVAPTTSSSGSSSSGSPASGSSSSGASGWVAPAKTQ